jgi:multiple sugar transport system substrate-binding protein
MPEKLRIAIRKFDPFESAIRKQFADFSALTRSPLELEYESLDLNPLVDTLFTRSGLKDGSWDVAFIVTDWLADAIADGSLVDLAPFMRSEPVDDYPIGWSGALNRFQQFDGALYGLPYHDGPQCFIYRTDLLEDSAEQAAFADRYGYPPAVPATWDQFADMARFFTRPERELFGTVFAAFPDGHNSVYDFCLQLWSRGGELVDQSGSATIDTPAGREGLDFYRSMVANRTATLPGLDQIDSVKSGEMFAAGSIAMMVNWFGFAAVCEQPGCPVKGKVAVAPPPAGAGHSSAALNVYWVLGVGSGSKHKEEAYRFIRHCCSPAMDKLTTLEGGIGCRLSTWNDPEVNAAIPFYHKLADLHQHTRELPRSRDLPKLVHIIDTAVQQAIRSDEPTDAILARAQQAASELQLR